MERFCDRRIPNHQTFANIERHERKDVSTRRLERDFYLPKTIKHDILHPLLHPCHGQKVHKLLLINQPFQ